MEKQYYFTFIAFGLLAIVPLHFYLKAQFKEQADNSLLWFAAGLGTWLLLLWVEMKGSTAENVVGIRRILSVANSACFILFLSYFKEGWRWLNQRIKNVTATPERLVLVLASLVLVIAVLFFEEKTPWLRAETFMSILVSLLLTLGFVLSFARRSAMRFMIPLALLGGLLLVYTQLVNLENEGGLTPFTLFWNPGKDLVFLRLLAFFCLIINTIALAMSALGEAFSKKETKEILSTQIVTSSDEVKRTFIPNPNLPLIDSIKISGITRHIEVFFYINNKAETPYELKYDSKELSKTKRSFLLKHIQSPTVRSSEFNNYSKEKREFVAQLNRKAKAVGVEIQVEDLIADGNETGVYRLALPSSKVVIDAAAKEILGIE